MPILNFTMRSQEMDGGKDSANGDLIAQKTIRLEKKYKIKYLKLLHIYHNINYTSIQPDDSGTMTNTILFCRISFLNSNNCVYYEYVDNGEIREHSGMICLGESVKDNATNSFRDTYKVLHDGTDKLWINEPFTVSLYQLSAKDPAVDNTTLSTYNDTGSHLIVPITQDQFRGELDGPGQYISFVMEYVEDYSK